ncbi:uncharacterized protein LOC126982380 [Eriocheir sinensis]|uniref:uncharacterized protein LOC126982380 n=1 Tax=Eriocheir sinensis TaxID=95602 RepID=UPI0021C9C84B|nr:uncharacterized protein LOC126982380 [Eriocheir sinensis]
MALSPVGVTGVPTSFSGYTQQDANFGRLYKAATQTSKRVLKAVFLLLLPRIRVAEMSCFPSSIADYCMHVLNWSNTKFRSSFNSEERTLLQQPVVATDMDVSLLSKLFFMLFGDLNIPESLWRAVRNIKNVRNRVCHEHFLLDEEQLAKNLSDLKAMYEALLDQTKDIFAAEVDDLKKAFYAEVDEIMSTSVPVEASEYFDKVEQFRIQLVGQFIRQSQRELMEYYAKLKVLNPFTWLSSHSFPQLQVDRIFTPLLITEQTRKVEAAALLATEVLNSDTEEDSGVLPDVLVLAGIAGCGKTSLCRYLLHDWHTKEGSVACLRSVDVLLYIEARNVTSPSLATFLQKALLPNTCSHFEEKDILQTLRQVAVLYVIDGMDEATADARELLNDVFSLAGDARVLVTTRPEFTSSVTQLAEHHHLSHMTFKVHGFSDEGRRSFVARVFAAFVPDEAARQCQEREFLKFLKTSCQGLVGHLKLPLTLALLVCLWRDDKTSIANVNSATRLYAEIFKLCTSKMATRLHNSATPLLLDLQDFVASWFMALGREAYRMLEEGRLIIDGDTQRQLVALCEGKGLASLQVFSTFLHCEMSVSLLGVCHNFSFVHKSQMEYLAALYIYHELMKELPLSKESVKGVLAKFNIFGRSMNQENRSGISDIILFAGWGAKWVNTWLFVVGHLCMSTKVDSVLQVVLDIILSVRAVTQNEITMWRLVEESGRHPIVKQRVGAAMNRSLNWRPNEVELCDVTNPVLMLMQHTTFTPQAVYLRLVGSQHGTLLVDEDGHPRRVTYHSLPPILTCLTRRPSCMVFLRLDEQYYTWGGEETADELLKALQSKGNVVTLMGHLGPQGATALSTVREIGDLQVRISQVATLKELARGLLGKHGSHVGSLTLRLDLPFDPPTATLPRLLHPANITIILRGVNDAVVATTAKMVKEIFPNPRHLDLVASTLTQSGAHSLLAALKTCRVTVLSSLTVRSPYKLSEDARLELQAVLGDSCALYWWS